MTRGITQNYWRFCEPEAPNLEYGCLPNKKVFVKLRQELTHGVRPYDEVVNATDSIQAGYFCNFVIDIPVAEGIVHVEDDGRGFWYVPTKNFVGEDKLSYRIINVMNQTSEPGCITFYVDHNQVPERIERVPIKLKTTILQDGTADYWVETNEDRKVEKERLVYAYNTLPDSNYVLCITGTWHAKYITSYGLYNFVHDYSGTIPLTVLGTSTTVSFADYDVLKFTAAIDDATIGLPEFWPEFTTDGVTPLFDVVFNVGIRMSPIDNNRIIAEPSNLLNFVEENENREISETNRKRLGNKSTYYANISTSVKQPVLLVNGNESICCTRSTKNNRSIDISGLTFDGVADANKLVAVVEQAYFDPMYNSATVDTVRNKTVGYNYLGFDAKAKVISLTFLVANVPVSDTETTQFALVADIPDFTSVFAVPGFDPKFLEKDADGAFTNSTDYKGLLVIDTFVIPAAGRFTSTDEQKTTVFCITKKFCSNIEYVNAQTTCLDAWGNLEFVPVDFSKVRGFVVVPYTDTKAKANKKMLSSTYIPILSSSTNVYPDISGTTQQVAFYGAPDNNVSPAINYPQELLKWKFFPKIAAPDIVSFFVVENDAKLKARWRLVQKTNEVTDTELQLLVKQHRLDYKEEWEYDRVYFDSKTIAVYDKIGTAAPKTLHKSAYPDIISIARQTPYENVGPKTANNSTNVFFLVIDLERTDTDLTIEHTIEVMTYDATTKVTANSSRITFDSPVSKISLVYAEVAVLDGILHFVELQKSVEY